MKRLVSYVKTANAPGFTSNLNAENQLEIIKSKDNLNFNDGYVVKTTGQANAIAGTWAYDRNYNIYATEVYVANDNNKLTAAIISHEMNDSGQSSGNVFVEFKPVTSLPDAARLIQNNYQINSVDVTPLEGDSFTDATEAIETIKAEQTEQQTAGVRRRNWFRKMSKKSILMDTLSKNLGNIKIDGGLQPVEMSQEEVVKTIENFVAENELTFAGGNVQENTEEIEVAIDGTNVKTEVDTKSAYYAFKEINFGVGYVSFKVGNGETVLVEIKTI